MPAHEQATLRPGDRSAQPRRGCAHGGQRAAAAAARSRRLLALGEAYPDLKASANFQALQGELADVEDKLAAARRSLNASAAQLQHRARKLPGSAVCRRVRVPAGRVQPARQPTSARPWAQCRKSNSDARRCALRSGDQFAGMHAKYCLQQSSQPSGLKRKCRISVNCSRCARIFTCSSARTGL